MTTHVDVLIVGAGLSGIGAAYYLQTACPNKSYAIVEARQSLGGTWDLFQYPGIRCDSDMYTFSYSFRPWSDAKVHADGPAIREYLRSTAEMYGILPHIRFQRRMEHASFSTADALWTVDVRDTASGELQRYTCKFLYTCCGYYDYEQGYTPEFPGSERFQGRIVHPQKWTPEIDYKGKRVIVIGSGATAVTLVPAIAKTAAHVIMLQRTPTYIVSMPGQDRIAQALRGWLPEKLVYRLTRWKYIAIGTAAYQLCRRFPERAKKLLLDLVRKSAGSAANIERDFTPPYKPWDQRMCIVPDNDFFTALRAGKAAIATGQIATFTETGIRLQSGEDLPADLIVTATGLNLKFQSGARLTIDGAPIDATRCLIYRGLMLNDVPNFAFTIGYSNASWTLRAELTARYVCRVLQQMDERKIAVVCPRLTDPNIRPEPVLDLTSGYVQRGMGMIPQQGSAVPWKVYQNYARDLLQMRYGKLDDGVLQWQPGQGSVR